MPEASVFLNQSRDELGGGSGVPKEYAHLTRDDALLVTGWSRRENGNFFLTTQWPEPGDSRPYDPRVLTQAVRQTGLIIAHAEYGVPLSHQTLLHHFDFTVMPGFHVTPGRTSTIDIEITVSEPKRRGRITGSLGMTFRLLQGNTEVARADTDFGWISPGAYQRLRGERLSAVWGQWPLPEPVPPRSVGRSTVTDVVLAPAPDGEPGRWQLRNDTGNFLLYDHPVDHVPGLVLMEAAHQAAHATLRPAAFEPTAVTSSFERYVEFDRPCCIRAESLPSPGAGRFAVLVTGTQDGQTVFRSELSGPRD